MFIAVERHGLAILPEIAFGRLSLTKKALTVHKAKLHPLACRIVDEH
jgi:hypothetical protein